MQRRPLGNSGLEVSVLGFGAGAVGGLMVRGDPAEQDRAIRRAIEAGITYFDTAPLYGDGASETHLGRVLRGITAEILIGTKIRLAPEQRADPAAAIAASLEASLRRLGRDSVDLFQLHNPIAQDNDGDSLAVAEVLERILPALEAQQRQGKTRCIGITAIGDPAALRAVIESGRIHAAQIPFNLLNPSAAGTLPPGVPGQDLEGLALHAEGHGVGVIAIRVLAGGALSAEPARHPVAMAEVAPIASGPDYAADVAEARRLLPLVAEGHAGDLIEAALRFATGPAAISTALVGTASLAQLEHAIAAVARGPLSEAALRRLAEIRAAPR